MRPPGWRCQSVLRVLLLALNNLRFSSWTTGGGDSSFLTTPIIWSFVFFCSSVSAGQAFSSPEAFPRPSEFCFQRPRACVILLAVCCPSQLCVRRLRITRRMLWQPIATFFGKGDHIWGATWWCKGGSPHTQEATQGDNARDHVWGQAKAHV